MTNVADITKTGAVDEVTGTIIKISEPETVNLKAGGTMQKQDGVFQDEAGDIINITFWDQDVAQFSKGDKITIQKGYAKEFKEDISLSRGKFGVILKAE